MLGSDQERMTKYEEDTENRAIELEVLKQRRCRIWDRFEELVQAYEGLERIWEQSQDVEAPMADSGL
ncbi:hypothetical protein HK097_003652 [Rhizophlyctis rosea]|uniref:Uncharacterized protein n=1 Tax=Rhizophlyctis rosea TaxID=64517 RepID=A0AAD5SI12_9FUNG|nr:hypothetical protein HK097_003652 [Rhizophlyctis rosea]